MRARVTALAALVIIACLTPAAAAQFSVNNTRLHLDAGKPVETLVLSNRESRTIAFEVHAKRWTQKADGTWELVPTQDLVVTPLIVKLPPEGEARLRVGTLSPNVASEHAYRLEINELPEGANVAPGQVRMLTTVSLPVFVEPANAAARFELAVDAIDAKIATLSLRNTGTAYAPPERAGIRVLDASGKILHEGTLETNYVLAGARLPLRATVPASACARASRIELTIGDDAPIVATLAPGQRRCAP